MGKIKNLTDKRFGKLTVICPKGKNNEHRMLWLCKCDCGGIKIVSSASLLSGRTNSCGCIHRDQLTSRNTTHGLSSTRLYRIWRRMKARCYNSNTNDYKYYGARGICVWTEWKDNFMTFYNWSIDNGYTTELTIDRVNVNGDYEPSNCRWVTMVEQNKNKRKTK